MEYNEKKWVKAYVNSMIAMSKLKITAREFRVLLYMVGLLTSKNSLINMSQKQIGEDLELDQADVSRAINKFKKLNILIQHKKGGHLFMNNEIFQFGLEINPIAKKSKWGEISKTEDLDKEVDDIFA